ncbi:MAG: VWA domain-containing protein, partial [Anaerolineae bacterium]|nr:VWA domain-containing protein [Anaerolineae bacterium]
MAAFQFKTYYNPYISPMTNAVWGVISVTANEMVEQTQDTIISLICDVSGSMQGAKFNSMIATTEDLIRNVPDGITFNIVVFDSSVNEVLPATKLQPGMDRERLVDQFRHT